MTKKMRQTRIPLPNGPGRRFGRARAQSPGRARRRRRRSRVRGAADDRRRRRRLRNGFRGHDGQGRRARRGDRQVRRQGRQGRPPPQRPEQESRDVHQARDPPGRHPDVQGGGSEGDRLPQPSHAGALVGRGAGQDRGRGRDRAQDRRRRPGQLQGRPDPGRGRDLRPPDRQGPLRLRPLHQHAHHQGPRREQVHGNDEEPDGPQLEDAQPGQLPQAQLDRPIPRPSPTSTRASWT